MDLELEGKRAVVVGATRGIGRAIALALSDETYLLSAGPRARISQHYEVPFGRPRCRPP